MESIDLQLNTDTAQADKSIDALNKSIIELNKNLTDSGKEAKEGMAVIDEGAKKAG